MRLPRGTGRRAPRQRRRDRGRSPAIIGLRPTVSNSRPSSSGPRKLRDREDRDVERHRARADLEELAEQRAEVEGDRVVEERLADEQGEAEHRAPRIRRERGAGDLAEADPLALVDRDDSSAPQLLAGLLATCSSISRDDLLGLLLAAVDEQPARALRHVAADEQDPDAERRAPRPNASRQPTSAANRRCRAATSEASAPPAAPSQ